VNKAASVWPQDHAQAALRYRKAAASTLAGSIDESCAVSRLARVSHVMHMLGRRPRPFSTHGMCVPRLALVRAGLRCTGCRSSRLIRLSKCSNRREDGERREDKRGP
jgi:hypothetical protein